MSLVFADVSMYLNPQFFEYSCASALVTSLSSSKSTLLPTIIYFSKINKRNKKRNKNKKRKKEKKKNKKKIKIKKIYQRYTFNIFYFQYLLNKSVKKFKWISISYWINNQKCISASYPLVYSFIHKILKI